MTTENQHPLTGEFSVKEARFYFDYNPVTGSLSVSDRSFGKYDYRKPVKSSLYELDGYLMVKWLGRSIGAHRLAWFMYYGVHSLHVIDHIDRDRGNIAISNLRELTASQNSQNCEKKSNSKTGLLGVHRKGKRFAAKIIVQGKTIELGVFDTPEEASAAYLSAREEIYVKP